MSEINLQGLEAFLKDLKETLKEAKEIKEALESLTDSNKKTLKENAEALKKRIDANMKLTQDSVDVDKISKEDLAKIVYVFEPYKQGKKYVKGDKVEQHGRLFKCLKNHVSDYQNMPNLDSDTWQEIKGTGEVVTKPKEREFYSSDKTYRFQ